MQDIITFQLATHYLSKVALRLECLYESIDQACRETHPIIHHYALQNIIEINKLIEKPELKSRFLKEFMRIEHHLNKFPTTLTTELNEQVYVQIQILTHVAGPFGGMIHQDPFLQSIRQAQPGHCNDFELYTPQLSFWLEANSNARQNDITNWLSQLHPLHQTVSTYLKLLRNTAQYDHVDLYSGFYQRPLPPKTSCHLILLKIDKTFGIVPRMQLGHHGLSLRLCEATTMREIHDIHTKLDIGLCQI